MVAFRHGKDGADTCIYSAIFSPMDASKVAEIGLRMTNKQHISDILARLQSVYGSGDIALHEPLIDDLDKAAVMQCLDTGFVSTAGTMVNEFEAGIRDFTGARNAVAVVNGTSGLHLSMVIVGVQANDEVLLPALNFVAAANAITYCGAVPHFVDSSKETLGICPDRLVDWLDYVSEMKGGACVNKITGRRISAIIPMHTFGHPCDMEALIRISADRRIALIEDAAEALGSSYQGRHVGCFGELGVFSFNGNKVITTGGGGIIVSDNQKLTAAARHLSTTARKRHRWEFEHDMVGFNYRMPNLNAALGVAQLQKLDGYLKVKRSLFKRLKASFRDCLSAQIFSEPSGSESNYWLQTLMLSGDYCSSRDKLLDRTNAVGIGTRPVWNLLNSLDPFKKYPTADVTVAEDLAGRIINLPSGPGILKT